MKLKRIVLPILAAASISTAVPAIAPQPAAAAGFLQNSLANFADTSVDTNIKELIKLFAAVAYFIPALALVGTVAAVLFFRKSDNEGAVSATLITGVVLGVLIGCLWWYDTKAVGKLALNATQVQAALAVHIGTLSLEGQSA